MNIFELNIDIPNNNDSMGLPRAQMPQIHAKDYKEYVKYLKSNGIEFKKESSNARSLRPMQSEFSKEGVLKQLEKNLAAGGSNSKPIIASSDNYIIDGHHRWLAAKNIRGVLNVYRANVEGRVLLDLTLKFPKVYFKDIYTEGYKLQLERDADMMVLNITDTATGKRTEVRGKPGYETSGYDPEDRLHQLLDKIGRSASVSDMMNGDVVTINPNHPKGASAKAAATTAFNESLDNPYTFKFTGPNDAQEFSATAQTPNGVLRMDFETTDYDNFGIDFSVGKSMGKTDAGDEFRVFATVVAMMKKWISTVGIKHVESFDFGANKDEHASDGRARLYTRFAKKLASQLGWKLEQSTTRDGGTAFFRLINPKPIPREQEYWDALEENINEAAGRVVKGVNTTPDVGVNQTSVEAKKFGNTVDKDGKPPLLSKKYAKNTTPSNTYNLGLSEHYTPMEIAIIEGGHCLEDAKPQIKTPGKLFKSLAELEENFADGKKKGKSRPGRVKRSGASCNGSVTELRKKAKNSSGERAKMYHWCANMKSGRKK